MATEARSFDCEANIFVQTPEGFEAHVKVTGIDSGMVQETLAALSGRLLAKGFAASGRHGSGTVPGNGGTRAAPAPREVAQKRTDVSCFYCGGKTWDNSQDKKNPRGPDFKCRDKACDGAAWIKKEDGQLDWRPGRD